MYICSSPTLFDSDVNARLPFHDSVHNSCDCTHGMEQDLDREVFDEVGMSDVHRVYFCHATVAAATARTDRWVRKGKQGMAPNAAPVWMSVIVEAA